MDRMSRVAIVTGANQGLGFALAEGLAQRLAPGDTVYLTGRDAERVRAAVERVARPRADVRGEVLDVRHGTAIAAFADAISERHGGVDIVMSNAAARLTPRTPWAELVGPFVDTNNLGTTRMLRAFDPILRRSGRLLIVASDFGSLRRLPAHLHERFDTETMTLDDVDATMLAWRDAVVEGRAADEGWPDWINIPSKVGQVAAVRVLARERRAADRVDGTLVAAVCPGLIDTDASRAWFDDMGGAQTPSEAALPVLRLALDDEVDQRCYGELVQFGNVVPWRDARPEAKA
jgi:NAD(P)-dependent dehydrogenase (short-subunit alcohol dehydrogenase family)